MMPSTLPVDIVPEPGETLTQAQSFQLMSDAGFRGRVQVCCLAYAQTISLEPTGTPFLNTLLRWAQSVYQNPTIVAAQITPPTVLNPNVQQAGSDISDQSLQAAVQAVVNATL